MLLLGPDIRSAFTGPLVLWFFSAEAHSFGNILNAEFKYCVCSGLTWFSTIFQSYHNGVWLRQGAQWGGGGGGGCVSVHGDIQKFPNDGVRRVGGLISDKPWLNGKIHIKKALSVSSSLKRNRKNGSSSTSA